MAKRAPAGARELVGRIAELIRSYPQYFPDREAAARSFGVSERRIRDLERAARGEIPVHRVIPSPKAMAQWEDRYWGVQEAIRKVGLAQMEISFREVRERLGVEVAPPPERIYVPVGMEEWAAPSIAEAIEREGITVIETPYGPLTAGEILRVSEDYRQVRFVSLGQALSYAMDLMAKGVPSSYLHLALMEEAADLIVMR